MKDREIEKRKELKQINYVRSVLSIIIWIFLWQLLSYLVANPIFFPGPLAVLKELRSLLVDMAVYKSILSSLLRIMSGFLAGFASGYLLALGSSRWMWVKDLLAPFVALMKAVPVASVVVLLLIWFGSGSLAFFVTFMVVFPNIYLNVLEGISQAPAELLEMSAVYRMPLLRRYRYIIRPSIWSQLKGPLKFSVGMSFKSGVAAEVIGLTNGSIGEGLYFSKIYLDTAGVFAWTAIILLLSALMERIVYAAFHRIFGMNGLRAGKKAAGNPSRAADLPEETAEQFSSGSSYGSRNKDVLKKKKENDDSTEAAAVDLRNVSKSYHDKILFQNLSFHFAPGTVTCLQGESGSGKTTLLKIIAGLVSPDEGKTEENTKAIAMQFQEDRLIPDCSAVENILLAGSYSKEQQEAVRELAGSVLGTGWETQPVAELSGGMRRRVSLLRALCHSSRLLLLDEPFTGLDPDTKARMRELVKEFAKDRTVVIAVHDAEEAALLEAETLRISDKG